MGRGCQHSPYSGSLLARGAACTPSVCIGGDTLWSYAKYARITTAKGSTSRQVINTKPDLGFTETSHDSIAAAVLLTLIYADLFAYPLTPAEVFQYLIG